MKGNFGTVTYERRAALDLLAMIAFSAVAVFGVAYAYWMWGEALFARPNAAPYTDNIANLGAWHLVWVTMALGLAGLVFPAIAVSRLSRELAAARAQAGAYAKDLAANRDERMLLHARFSAVEAELYRAKETSQKANKAKSEFLANISHELRTPMNAVLGMAETLSRSALSARQRRFVDAIRQGGWSLLALIDDILDFSKFDTGSLSLRESNVNVRAMADGFAKTFAAKAQEKNLEFFLEIADEVPPCVRADGKRILKVLSNLMSNAIKFTEEGRVGVDISFRRLSGQEGAMSIVVSDTGIGIAEADHARIFNAFEQVDGTLTRSAGGTGLGLAITKKLVELMDGTISVTSRPGEGSTFTVVIPMAIAASASGATGKDDTGYAPGGAAPAPAAIPQYGFSILVVEDSSVNREVALEHLASLGCNADVAVDGEEAIQAFQHKKYDLILMDCQMPRCDGYEATRRMRAIESEMHVAQPTPIIALTANAMSGDREKCLNSGMSDYLAKPYALEDLVRTFDRWCQDMMTNVNLPVTAESQKTQSEASAPVAAQPSPEAIPKPARPARSPFDDAIAGRLRTKKAALWGRLVKAFLLQAGSARSSMQGALNAADFETIKTVAHSFKSAGANIGAMELSEICRRLEAAAHGKEGGTCAQYGTEFESAMADVCDALEKEDAMLSAQAGVAVGG